MKKQILLTAQAIVNYGGQSYAPNSQFHASQEDAERLTKSGECVLAAEADKTEKAESVPAKK